MNTTVVRTELTTRETLDVDTPRRTDWREQLSVLRDTRQTRRDGTFTSGRTSETRESSVHAIQLVRQFDRHTSKYSSRRLCHGCR